MISKEKFIKILTSLKEAEEKDEEYSKAVSSAFDCWALRYVPCDAYTSIIIDLLNEMFDLQKTDEYGSDIDYFIYELDYGKKWKRGMITDKNGVDVDFSDAGRLYDYLIKSEDSDSEIISGC